MGNIKRAGFWPVGTLSGAPWTGAVRRIDVDGSTNVCLGDPIAMQANGIGCLSTTANSAALLGFVVGIEPVTKSTTTVQGASTSLEVKYIPKGTAGKVLVSVGPDTIYECLANFGANTTNIGENANIIIGDNTAVSVAKISNAVINSKALAATLDGQVKIIGIVDRPDNTNTFGAADSNTLVQVVLNKGLLKPVPGAGI